MHVKVYLHSPPDIMVPDLPPTVKAALPDVQLPSGATVETLLQAVGVGRARPQVLINKIVQKADARLHEGDRVDLVLPLGGG